MKERRSITYMLLLLVWSLLALLSRTASWQFVENVGFDVLTLLSVPEKTDLPIVIVGIDEPSFADLEKQWPWPRSFHGRLVEALHRNGATVIALDMVFAEPSVPEEDALFAAALRKAGEVILAGDISYLEREQFDQILRIEPISLFKEANVLTGISSIRRDGDLVVRNIPRYEDAFWAVVADAFCRHRGKSMHESALPDQAHIRYVGPDHTFPYVSYYQALNPETMLPPGFFKGKMVLVGFDLADSAQPETNRADAFATPFSRLSGRHMSGVEIQANCIWNALEGRSIAKASPFYSLSLLGLAMVLSQFGMARWSPLRGAVVAFTGMLGMGGLSFYLFNKQDLWTPIGIFLTAPALLFVGRSVTAFIGERNRRREISRAFQYYVSPQVVSEMIRHPEKLTLGGVRKRMTILFTDLQGFTQISESLEPEQVARLLNQYFTAMTRIILQNGGTVDKFIGDAVMAFWGAPLEDPDQALHAVTAAVEMQRALKKMRENFAGQGIPEFYMRIGIHSGDAVVGNMGSAQRFDYSAMGDTVNIASRLEGANKLYGSEILISETTAGEVIDRIPLLYLDPLILKGKTKKVPVYTYLVEDTHRLKAESAIGTFRERRWEESEILWRELHGYPETALIAACYLKRIRGYRDNPPPPDWDGSVALDTK